jgi:hypothetical protein
MHCALPPCLALLILLSTDPRSCPLSAGLLQHGQKKLAYKVAAVNAYVISFYLINSAGKQQPPWEELRREFRKRAPEANVSYACLPTFAKKRAKRFEDTGSRKDFPRRRPKVADEEVMAIAGMMVCPPEVEVALCRMVGRGRKARLVYYKAMRKLSSDSIKPFVIYYRDLVKVMHPKTVLRLLHMVCRRPRLSCRLLRTMAPLGGVNKKERKTFHL